MGDTYYYEDGTETENQTKSYFVLEIRKDITNVKEIQRNISNSMKILLSVLTVLVVIVLAVLGLLVYFTFIGTNDNQTHNQNDLKEQIKQMRKLVENEMIEMKEHISQTAQDCPNKGFRAGSFCYFVSDKTMTWNAAQEV